MLPPLRLAVLLATLLLAAAAGCGSDAGVAGRPADAILRTTFGPDKQVASGRLDVGLSLDAEGLGGVDGPVRLNLRGPFASPEDGRGVPAFAFDLVLGAGGDTFTAGAVSTGKAGFLTYGGTSYALDEPTWTELERGYVADQERAERAGGQTLSALGVDPLRWLRDPVKAGEEDVGGVRTVHVRAGIDVPALLDDVDRILARAGSAGVGAAAGRDVPRGLSEARRRAIAASVRSATVDVFTGAEDGTLRRLNVQVAFTVPEASRAGAGGLRGGRLGLDLRLGELNEPQSITPPEDARPLSELTGAAPGGRSAPGVAVEPSAPAPRASAPAAPPAAAPPPAGSSGSPYLRCIDEAGSDLAEVQRCGELLEAP